MTAKVDDAEKRIAATPVRAAERTGSRRIAQKVGLSAVLLIATGLLFLGDHLGKLATGTRAIIVALPPVLLLGLTFLFQRSRRFRRYWEVTFAFFCGTLGLFFAWSMGSWPMGSGGVSASTVRGVAILKLSELVPVALPIIVLTRVVQGTLAPIYIQRGNLRKGMLGLILGLLVLAVYLGLSWSRIDAGKFVGAIGWVLIFALSNAFFEELLVRGLFLKRFNALLGKRWALVLSTLCYGLFIVGVQSASGPVSYVVLAVVLPLGLLYGFLVKHAGSIWGAVSLHAALDVVLLIEAFALA
jgi:membrane protease YdiL (CAAX protease family)